MFYCFLALLYQRNVTAILQRSKFFQEKCNFFHKNPPDMVIIYTIHVSCHVSPPKPATPQPVFS